MQKTMLHTITAIVITASSMGISQALSESTADLQPIGGIGKGEQVLKGDTEAVLYEHQGKGCLTHFWFGGNFEGVEDTRIRYYIDGEPTPSIDMALYLGHGIGFRDTDAPWATKHVGKIGKHNGIFNNYRIPFGKSIRVTAQRSSGAKDTPMSWWIIRGVENGRITLGGAELPETARLKLHRLENHTAEPMEDFNLCDVKGHGAVYQVTIAAQGPTNGGMSFLEGCMRAYTNGAKEPIMLSSGLEHIALYADTFEEPEGWMAIHCFEFVFRIFCL